MNWCSNTPTSPARPTPFVPGESAVPVSGKVIGAAELQNMVEAALDGWLTTGRFNDAFEKRLAAFLGVKHLITVNSGSSANLVAFSALTRRGWVSAPSSRATKSSASPPAFPTTVNPILQFGAVPVFVDVDLATHNIDATQIEAAIWPKTKAIMLAHTLGNPFNLDVVDGLCRKKQPVAGRGLLRRARLHLRRPAWSAPSATSAR